MVGSFVPLGDEPEKTSSGADENRGEWLEMRMRIACRVGDSLMDFSNNYSQCYLRLDPKFVLFFFFCLNFQEIQEKSGLSDGIVL